MAPSVANVAAAKPFAGGGVYFAPIGTALPTDASVALDAAFVPLGYISTEGIRPNRETSVEKVKAWGGDVVDALLTDESRSFEFTLIEVFSQAVNEFVYGQANVTVTAATALAGTKTAIVDKGGKPDRGVVIFEMKHGAKRRRVVVPVADSVVTGEEPFVDGSASAYTVQTEALKDGSGNRVYDYLENDDKLPPSPPPAWAATTAYALSDFVTLTGGATLEATTAGTSGSTEPAAPASVGGTVVDGTVTWTRRS